MTTLDWVLFALRIGSGLALIVFMGTLFIVLWRDYRSAAGHTEISRRVYGKLVQLADVDDRYMVTGDVHPLTPLTTLGRAPTNAVMIDDDFTSTEHASITLRNQQWWLEDRNSRNGTLLNGEPISAPVIVTDGDIISIGNTHFKLQLS